MALPWQSSPGFISTHINTFIYVNMIVGAVADMVTAPFFCPLLSRVFGFLSLDSTPHNAIHTYLRNTFRKGRRALDREGVCDMGSNPRYSNGNLRRKHRARLRAIGGECGICKGKLGPIHYDDPSDAQHPLSFVVDEILPVSRWREFGYDSPQAAAQDWNNLQPAHYICNAHKSNRVGDELRQGINKKARPQPTVPIVLDGNW